MNLFPTQPEELLLGTTELAPHFPCVLTRQGHLDALTVLVEPRTGVAAGEPGDRLRKLVARSAGKTQRVVDHRPQR